jgi:hypothetical protein
MTLVSPSIYVPSHEDTLGPSMEESCDPTLRFNEHEGQRHCKLAAGAPGVFSIL